jgi:hypothetical protein
MRLIPNGVIGVAVGSLVLAGVIGASLGVVFAAQTRPTLVEGVNPTVGGPLNGDVTPEKFMSCLPPGSWSSIYLWDPAAQGWLHYFNTDGTDAPVYINDPDLGGIDIILGAGSSGGGSGLSVIMNETVQDPFLPGSQTDICPS